MTVLYDRTVSLRVAGLTIDGGLRIYFEIERRTDSTQVKGGIDIYNLSKTHEERIYERGVAISLSAGYPQTQAIIFEGVAQRVERVREGLSRITKIKIGDKAREPDTLSGVMTITLNGPETVRNIAGLIAKEIGLPLGPVDAIPEDAVMINYARSGSAERALTALLERVECTWFEADGLIRINRRKETQPDAPAFTLSPETGLVGSPSVTEEGAECRMFLNPLIAIGSAVTLESDVLKGRWKVVSVRHTGDNWQGPFETAIDLRELDG